jgi:hypothetical protein
MRNLIIGLVSTAISFIVCGVDDPSGRICMYNLFAWCAGGLVGVCCVWAVLADRHGVSFDDLFPDDEFDISFLKSANIGNDWTIASREKAVLAFLGGGVLGALGTIYIKIYTQMPGWIPGISRMPSEIEMLFELYLIALVLFCAWFVKRFVKRNRGVGDGS